MIGILGKLEKLFNLLEFWLIKLKLLHISVVKYLREKNVSFLDACIHNNNI